MKPIIITILTLFILGECFSQNVQSNNSFIFQPTTNPVTTFRIKGIFSSDSAIYLPIRENNWTPTRSGAIQFAPTQSAPYYYNMDSAKWLPFGSGGGSSPPSLATLSPGFGLIGVTYDPYSTNQTWLVDTSQLLTINNFLTNYFDTSSGTTTTFFNVVSINNTPPVSPLDSSYYLVGTAPTGIWITHENQVAQRLGTGWAYTTPEISQTLTDISTQTIYIWNGTAWVKQPFAILGQLNPQDVDLRVGSIPNKALNFYTDSTYRFGISNGGDLNYYRWDADTSTAYTLGVIYKNGKFDTVHARDLILTTTGSSGAATLINNVLNIPQYSGGGGGGTVTSFSAGTLSPLFTTSVATATSTPALTFAQSNTTQFTVLGRIASGSGAYSFVTADSTLIQGLHSEAYYNTKYGTGNGTVTSVATNTGTGITGGTITTTGTLAIDTNLISTRAWRQKGIDSVVSLIPSVTPAALTKTDDANVTLTLGGTPATSLLQATSLTLGWTGTLAATRGGTGTGTVATGDLLYGSGTNAWSKLNIGTTGQHLVIVGGLPVWRDTTAATAGTITGAGNLSPLFTTGVSGANITFSLSNAAAHTFFGNFTGSTGAPSYSSPTLASADFANQGTATTLLHGNASGNPSFGSIVNADITNATIVASTKLSATGTPSATTYLRGDDTWATVSAGGGADTSHYVTPNLFKDSGYSDTKQIQRAVDIARVTGKTVYIAWNYKRNSNLWSIDSAVLLYSNCNIILDACKLKKSDSCRDNIMRTANCGYGITTAASNLDTNISIISFGGVIEGADNPRSSGDYNKTISLSPSIANGFSYGTDASVTGRSHTGDWRNYGIVIAYAKRVMVAGLTVSNMEAYGVSFERCRNVWVDNITADMNGYANGDTTRRLLNEGTLDFDQSVNNITVTNCRGFSQDDFAAANITNNDSTAGHYGYYPVGDTSNAARDSITNVYLNNIYVGSNANVFRTFIPPNSIHANGIRLQNITNSLKTTDPFFGRLNGTESSTIQIGATQTLYGGNVPFGNWSNISADNIRTLNSTYLIRVQNRIGESRFTNLYKPSALATADIAKDGAFADFKNVTSSNQIDSSRITIAGWNAQPIIQVDSLNRAYSYASGGIHTFLQWSQNVSLGQDALQSSTATTNTAVGLSSQHATITGSNNTSVGYSSLYTVTGGADNTAVGSNALFLNTANYNTAVGFEALYNNTADRNTAVGFQALRANTTGTGNSAFGNLALSSNTTSANSSAFGYQAAQNTTGIQNSAFGASALNTNTSGASNTAIGMIALQRLSTGSNNTALGAGAGYALTGSEAGNIFIGYDVEGASSSNKFYLDNANNTTNSYLYGDMTSTTNRYLKVNAGFANSYAAKTGTYSITNADHTIDCTSGTFTVTLPTAANVTGIEYEIVNSGSGTITIATTSSQTFVNINATPTTLTLAPVGAGAIVEYTVRSNGANWIVVGKVKNE